MVEIYSYTMNGGTAMESQSRYSIVERLTQRKLDIIDAKSEVHEKITGRKNSIERAKEELKYWETDIQEQNKRDKRQKDQHITELERDLIQMEYSAKDKRSTYDEKIEELDKALSAIQTISKDAPTPQEQA